MEAKDALELNLIKTSLKANNKDEALKELAELMLADEKIEDVDGFLKDVYEREAVGQTGIGNFIAIPHGKSKFVKKPAVAVGITDKELEWETLDDRGVKVVILFAVGADADAAKEHLRILSLFARKLGNDKVVSKLISANEPKDVILAFS